MFFLHFNGWTMSRYAFLCSVFLGFSCYGSETDFLDSDYYPKSQTTYGGVGLIATPTARFYEDGEFGLDYLQKLHTTVYLQKYSFSLGWKR